MTRSLRRTSGLAALALAATLGLAACGSDDDSGDDAASDATSESSSDSSMSESPSDSTMPTNDTSAGTFGAGCSALPANGAGSLEDMAPETVATAAGSNPLLTTLVQAVDRAGLVDTLNTADGITVFAPTNDAFAALQKNALKELLSDKEALTEVLTYHVVPGELSPDELAGTHETMQGEELTIEGSGEDFTVGAEDAKVVCGNIPTANATVYVIDGVLMP